MANLTVEDVNKTIDDNLSKVFEQDRFQDFLNVMSRMHNYSLNNVLLIMNQRPTASMVMGYKEWQKVGRHVKAGEKGIRILAPVTKMVEEEKKDPITKETIKNENGEPEKQKTPVIVGFRMVSVFDVEQTEGKEIPSVRDFIHKQLSDDTYAAELYKSFKQYLETVQQYNIEEKETDPGVGGYWERDTKHIVISNTENHNDINKFGTLIHEYAHSKLHHSQSEYAQVSREHREAQAEAVSYVVSQYYGLDRSDFSLGYISTWAKDVQLARQALTEVSKVSGQIIDEINTLQKEKLQTLYKDQQKEYEEAKERLIKDYKISEKAFDPETKEKTQLQLINRQTGYIMSAQLEYSEKNEMFYLRTNRNLIEPLSELSKNGNLAVLNVEQHLDEVNEITSYAHIPDDYTVLEVSDGAFVVADQAGEDIISKEFTSKKDATRFHLRASIGQSLHEEQALRREIAASRFRGDVAHATAFVQGKVNQSVGNYLSYYSQEKVVVSGKRGIQIGWAIMKNPQIKTIQDLQKFAEKTQHVPSYKGLHQTVTEVQKESKKQAQQEQELELTIE